MNLFIDTNIFLSFYDLTSDELEELKKLAVLIDKKKVTLLLPEHVIHEFKRHRAKKIAEAISKLRAQLKKAEIPQLAKSYGAYEALRNAQKEFASHLDTLIESILADGTNDNLEADFIIEELFGKAKQILRDETIINRAEQRVKLGDPPGKSGSIGDAVNWETLLEFIPKDEDIYIISDDGDFYSPLDKSALHEYLQEEWENKKDSIIYPYKRLSSFFHDHFPDIKLATELEKMLLIEELSKSPNFDTTRSVIARLRKFTDFSNTEVNGIVTAAVTNNQVYWIATYSTIKSFLESIIKGREDIIDPDNLPRIKYVVEKIEPYGEIHI